MLYVAQVAQELRLAGCADILVRTTVLYRIGRALILFDRPGLLSSLTGLITTFISIYTAKGGHWSVTAKMTIIVIGLYGAAMSILILIYDNWLLEKIKTPYDKELDIDTTE